MLSLVGRIKSHNGISFSHVHSFSLANNFFLQQLCRFSSSAANSPKPISDNVNQNLFAATYLRNTYGFSPEKALMYSKYLKFDSSERPDSVIAFFKNYHFTDAQISLIVRKWPLVFKFVPESSFRPKIEFFRSLFFSISDIVKLLTKEPQLLGRSLEGQIIPCVDFLSSFLLSDKDVILSITRFPRIFRENLQDTLLPNVEILRGVGVPESHIAALLKINPRSISFDPESFRMIVQEAQKLGLNPQKMNFVQGVIVMSQLSSSTWREKINFYKGWGWSENQVLDAFRKHPQFMAISTDKTTRILNLFANKMACGVSGLMKRTYILSLSFEKTIVPRCEFYQVLLSKGLIKQSFGLLKMLECPKRLFLGRYVQIYAERDPELLKQYQDIFGNLKG